MQPRYMKLQLTAYAFCLEFYNVLCAFIDREGQVRALPTLKFLQTNARTTDGYGPGSD